MSDELIYINLGEVMVVTEDATAFESPNSEDALVWIPNSQLASTEDIGIYCIPLWLAAEKELI